AVGGEHTCGIDRNETGVCWGWSPAWSGIGSTGSGAQQFSLIGDKTCAVHISGVSACGGRMGGSAGAPTRYPCQLDTLVMDIAAGLNHTCGLTFAGEV